MHKATILILTALLVAFSAGQAEAQEKINWRTYSSGISEASSSGKPIIMYVTGSGGEQMEKYLWEVEVMDHATAAKGTHVYIWHNVGVNGEDDSVAQRYDLKSWPVVLYCDQYGNRATSQLIGQVNVRQDQIRNFKKAIRGKMAKMAGDIKKLRHGLERKLATGEKYLKNGRIKLAVQQFVEITTDFEGYEEVATAQTHLDDLEVAARQLLEEAKSMDESAQKKALRNIMNDYKGLSVSDEAEQLLDDLD